MSLIVISIFLIGWTLPKNDNPYIIVLGIAQDGGAPHAACTKDCCIDKWDNPKLHNQVSSLGIVDPSTNEVWMIDATPDFSLQLNTLTMDQKRTFKGVFLTHAHIGHYTGLIHLGREVMGAKQIPVYAMPKMKRFLTTNGPWSQLVDLNNIDIKNLQNNTKIQLNNNLSITPFIVPHRDEFSETVGYKISGPNKSLIFIPDIDKWEKWSQNIEDVVENNDFSLLDGTFYDINELPGRDMSEIPHPFIVESMEILDNVTNKASVYFIHLNHTNPALDRQSNAIKMIKNSGFNVAKRDQRFHL
ncbi:MAG TPA: pyrroloquinoline quinone biosynthesis protein PqqB [Candidatus Marinimicrobia bacterium]|nr:pyrroloquinoline quinone biosynthesis protein PqqB [Candidatus Neomarinimicrobiota bacterium]HIL86489.1 pyrroloquinoline quinone biosynthesis protein PqqB [Candidatus Neomarinimicrobiota bacterium]